MLIAKENRKKNIAEYLIYMFQIEDSIRACNFDMEKIELHIINQYKQPEDVKNEIRDWYSNLIIMMMEEGIQKSGHLKILQSILDDLNDLHKNLLYLKKDPKYIELYSKASQNISIFRETLKEDKTDVDTCFHALYTLLLLRLKQQNVSDETKVAMQSFSNLMAFLSKTFKDIEEGKAEI